MPDIEEQQTQGMKKAPMMSTMSQEERDAEAKRKDGGFCFCGHKATGAWGLQVGHYNPFRYTPKMPYCSHCISDMIDGLTLVVKDLKKIRNDYRRKEGRPEINY